MVSLTQQTIASELYRTLVLLGAEHDLLGLIGSWGDGLAAEHVLSGLKAWNEATLKEVKVRIEHYEMTFPHLAGIPDEGHKT